MKTPMFRTFAVFLILIFALSMAIFLFIGIWVKPAEGSLEFEMAKVLLEIGLVSVVGALVSMITFEYQQERHRIDSEKEQERQRIDKQRDLRIRELDYRENLLKASLNQVIESYGDVKKARRLLRARAIIKPTESEREFVSREELDKNMDILNDAQLSFEQLIEDVKTSNQAFTQSEELQRHLRLIEGYIGHLIDEYEDKRKTFTGDPPSKELSSLGRLSDFLGPSRPSEFRSQVIEPYHKVQRLVRSDLSHPQLPKVKEAKAKL